MGWWCDYYCRIQHNIHRLTWLHYTEISPTCKWYIFQYCFTHDSWYELFVPNAEAATKAASVVKNERGLGTLIHISYVICVLFLILYECVKRLVRFEWCITKIIKYYIIASDRYIFSYFHIILHYTQKLN